MCINTSNGVLTPLQIASNPLNLLKIVQNRSKSLKNRLLAALAVDLEACFVLTPVLTPGLAVLTPLY